MSVMAAAPAVPRGSVGLRRDLLVGVGLMVAVVGAFVLAPVSGTSLGAVRLESAARVLAAGIPVAVGIYAWRGVPFQRLGSLLVVGGLVWLAVTFSLNDRALAYSIGRVADWLGWAGLLCLMLAFPEGRLVGRVDRVLAATMGVLVAALWLPTALLVDRYPTPSDWVTCGADCPHNAFMVLAHQPAVISQLVVPLREGLTVLLFVGVVARLVGRIRSASRVRRRTLTPVLVVAVAGIALTAFALVVRRVAPGSPLLAVLRWLSAFALPAMAVAFLVGLMRWRLYVGASLGRFAAAMSSGSEPEGMRGALAEAFEDPSLVVAYPVAGDRWAAADGRPADLPPPGSGRCVTEVRHHGQTVAALIHDVALQDEPAFVDAVGSYAMFSLENNRLAAELAHVVREMRDTQARSAASADHAREQIERDLHDGAQQRLIALRIHLQLAAERSPQHAGQLNHLGAEVQQVMDELRALARGLSTPVLIEYGPVAALRAAVRDAPIATTIDAHDPERHSPEVEKGVYFCCLEAIQNAYKHAGTATAVRVTIAERGPNLTFEISDNGVGFDLATIVRGAGIHNMHDRVASLDGSLVIEAAPGDGTRIAATIPLLLVRSSAGT